MKFIESALLDGIGRDSVAKREGHETANTFDGSGENVPERVAEGLSRHIGNGLSDKTLANDDWISILAKTDQGMTGHARTFGHRGGIRDHRGCGNRRGCYRWSRCDVRNRRRGAGCGRRNRR